MMPDMKLCRKVVDEHPYPLVFATVSGAHLYGFASADSDYDLRGVHVLPAREVLSLHDQQETISQEDVVEGVEIDLVTHDAAKFFRMLLKRNGYVLEQLLSTLVVLSSPEHEELKAFAKQCITRHHAHHYLGFAETQWNLFRKEDPPRVKPLLYMYRVLLTGIHLMRSGEINANLVQLNDLYKLPYVPDLIARKSLGHEQSVLPEAELGFHQSEYERLRMQLNEEFERSTLADQPGGLAGLSELLVRLRMATV
jgi:uncharacterized protein